MSLTVLLLLLQEQPQRLSKVVIVAAVLAFITGVALVVYFYRRFKATEKEAEDDWQAGMHALFVEPATSTATDRTGGTRILSSDSLEAESNAKIEQTIAAELYPTSKPDAVLDSETGLAGARTRLVEPKPPAEAPKGPTVETTPIAEPAPPVPAKPDVPAGGTQILASVPAESLSAESPSPFDDEVFADLETADSTRTGLTAALTDTVKKEEERIEAPQPTKAEAEVRAPRPTEPFEFSRKATPAQPRQRQPYEPPAISPIRQRESYEPPAIRRLEPRETPASAPRPAVQPTEAPKEAATPLRSARVSPAVAPPSLATARLGSPGLGSPQPAGISSRVPAGSVLGLPASASNAPLKLGTPARPQADVGIGSLVNYGKETDIGGKGGTIALAIVVLLVTGAILSYKFVPSVNSRVNHWVHRIRGMDQEQAQLAAQQLKAKILPRNSQPDKNLVNAGGAVENISDPPVTLENLEVEVSLERGNGGAPEIRRIPVNPPNLEPGQRGVFEFQYDGKRDTGFVMYKIIKLWSGDTPIRFTAPGLNR